MSVQSAAEFKTAIKVELIPSDIYYAHQPSKAAKPVAAQSAVEEMYAYYGSDLA